jgi:hypothetical protein
LLRLVLLLLTLLLGVALPARRHAPGHRAGRSGDDGGARGQPIRCPSQDLRPRGIQDLRSLTCISRPNPLIS